MPGFCNNATTSRDQLPQTFCSKPDTTGARAWDRLFSTRPMLGNILPRRRVSPRHSMVDQVATCAPSSFDRPRMSMLVPHFGFSFFQRLHRLLLRLFLVDGNFRGTLFSGHKQPHVSFFFYETDCKEISVRNMSKKKEDGWPWTPSAFQQRGLTHARCNARGLTGHPRGKSKGKRHGWQHHDKSTL